MNVYLVREIQRPNTNLVFTNFSQFDYLVEKENKLFIGPKLGKNCFGPIKSLFSFSAAQAEKNGGKTRLVVWQASIIVHKDSRILNLRIYQII